MTIENPVSIDFYLPSSILLTFSIAAYPVRSRGPIYDILYIIIYIYFIYNIFYVIRECSQTGATETGETEPVQSLFFFYKYLYVQKD